MHTLSDIRPFHRIVLSATADTVSAITPQDLHRPTPCESWNLGDLLAHMTVQHRGFAAAARGDGADAALWQPDTVTNAIAVDPAGTYSAAVDDVLDAFAADGVLEMPFVLPELGPGASFPGAMAIGFHFIDYVVHGWDVARSMGSPFELPADVVTAALPVALAVPDGDFRSAEGSVFARAIDVSAVQSDFDRILRHLGRSPGWAPPR